MKIFPPVVLALALCTPPLAGAALFEVTGNLTCTDPGDGAKLLNEKLSTPLMIQAALGGGDGKLYALVYDGNFDVDIVQRCDGMLVRSFVADGGRGTSFQSPAPLVTRASTRPPSTGCSATGRAESTWAAR